MQEEVTATPLIIASTGLENSSPFKRGVFTPAMEKSLYTARNTGMVGFSMGSHRVAGAEGVWRCCRWLRNARFQEIKAIRTVYMYKIYFF